MRLLQAVRSLMKLTYDDGEKERQNISRGKAANTAPQEAVRERSRAYNGEVLCL